MAAADAATSTDEEADVCEGEKTREERDAELLARRCRSRRVRQCRGRGRLGKFKLKGIVVGKQRCMRVGTNPK